MLAQFEFEFELSCTAACVPVDLRLLKRFETPLASLLLPVYFRHPPSPLIYEKRIVSEKVRIATRPGPPALPTIPPSPWKPFADPNNEDNLESLANRLHDLFVSDASQSLPLSPIPGTLLSRTTLFPRRL
jgi:hypothetical protein